MRLLGFEIKRIGSGPQRALTSELGATGTACWEGFLDSPEYHPKFSGAALYDTIDRMRFGDAQVHATLLALYLPILQATWTVVGEDPEVNRFVERNLFERLDWHEFLRHALLMLPYGHMAFEKVYEPRGGQWWLRKVAPRLPHTITRWEIDPATDTLGSITQEVPSRSEPVHIPRHKLVVFTFGREGNNVRGTSVLRAAYPHWYIKTQLYRLDAIAQERGGVGIPVWTLPAGYTEDDLDRARDICRNLRGGERTFVVKPEGHELEILGFEGKGRDPIPSIKHHDEMIARNILASFLNLGTTESGSRALAETSEDFFLLGVTSIARQIADTIRAQLLRQLVALNFPGEVACPRLVPSGVNKTEVPGLAQALAELTRRGLIQPDEGLERHLRDLLDLPQTPPTAPAAAPRPGQPNGNAVA